MVLDKLKGTYQDIKDMQDVKNETRRYMDMIESEADSYSFRNQTYYFKPNQYRLDTLGLEHDWDKHNKPEDQFNPEDLEYWSHQSKLIGQSKSSNHYGHLSCSPSAYFFYKFRKCKPKAGPMYAPTFRRYQAQMFGLLDNMIFKSPNFWTDKHEGKKGLVFLGPRQIGKSEFIGGLGYNMCLTHRNIDVLYNSDKEIKGKNWLMSKIKLPYDELPEPFKLVKGSTDSVSSVRYAKKSKKSDGGRTYGRNNKIYISAPSAKMVDGDTLFLWFADEGPITPDFESMFTSTKNTLWNFYTPQNGFFVSGGVAGEIDPENMGFFNVYDSAESFDLIRVFIPGWSSMYVDEYGNEDIEKAVFHILSERLGFRNFSKEKYLEQVAAYPLSVDEAKQSTSSAIGFDKDKINAQIRILESGTYRVRQGMWVPEDNLKGTEWKMKSDGKALMLELPQPGEKYISGTDVYGLKSQDKGSEGATTVFKLPNLMSNDKRQLLIDIVKENRGQESLDAALKLGGLPVLLYVEDDEDPQVLAKNSFLIQKAYGCIGAVERKPDLVFDWYSKKLMENISQWVAPKFVEAENIKDFINQKKYGDPDKIKYGQTFGDEWKGRRTSVLANYYSLYSYLIFIREFLTKGLIYNPDSQRSKVDSIDSLGLALLYQEQLELIDLYERRTTKKNKHTRIPGVTKRNGKFVRK